MNPVGIIPARAGSKRLPGKNLRLLAGRPLIAHTCRAALDSGVLGAVYANTDSADIAAAARTAGARCPELRPGALATDTAPTRDALVWMLERLADAGERYDAVVILQPTSPLRSAADIRAAWRLYAENAPCGVVSVVPVAPRSWLGARSPTGEFARWTGDETAYRLNGAVYVYAAEDLLQDRTPARTMAYVMPASRSVDIDTAEDFTLAEALLAIEQPVPNDLSK